MKATLCEAIVVAVLGAVLAFAANALSPRGLKLATDYFPGSHSPVASSSAASDSPTNGPESGPSGDVAKRLAAKGLQLADSNQVVQLFQDPRKQQDQVIFIDARDDHHFQDGHIPGAYQFDHYHAENYLGAIMPLCQAAQQIVVYCNGGECEDSEFAATMLRDLGVPKERILVYGGGITEWIRLGQATEVGERNSGVFRKP